MELAGSPVGGSGGWACSGQAARPAGLARFYPEPNRARAANNTQTLTLHVYYVAFKMAHRRRRPTVVFFWFRPRLLPRLLAHDTTSVGTYLTQIDPETGSACQRDEEKSRPRPRRKGCCASKGQGAFGVGPNLSAAHLHVLWLFFDHRRASSVSNLAGSVGCPSSRKLPPGSGPNGDDARGSEPSLFRASGLHYLRGRPAG